MAIDNLIITTINKNFKDNLYDELVIGKLANVQSKSNLKEGDEMDVEMPVTVDMFKYAGGDLPDAELVTQSYAKVRIEEGEAFHFEIDKIKVAHMGDYGETENLNVCKKLSGVDVLLIPIGGKYTINSKTAIKYIEQIILMTK